MRSVISSHAKIAAHTLGYFNCITLCYYYIRQIYIASWNEAINAIMQHSYLIARSTAVFMRWHIWYAASCRNAIKIALEVCACVKSDWISNFPLNCQCFCSQATWLAWFLCTCITNNYIECAKLQRLQILFLAQLPTSPSAKPALKNLHWLQVEA